MPFEVDMTYEWFPSPLIIQTAFAELSSNIRSFKEPIDRAIAEVVIPSIRENFAVGGRPRWAPLSTETIAKKGHETVLIDSGKLARVAAQKNIWQVNGGYLVGDAEAYIKGLPGAEYGLFHMTGTRNMPVRDFLSLQEEDVDRIEEIFGDYVDERIQGTVGGG
jgi:phage gpG-like protein